MENSYKSVKEEYEISIEDKAKMAGDLIYINPMLNNAYSENPFLEGFVKKDFGLDNISDELIRINATDRNSIQNSLIDFKENI